MADVNAPADDTVGVSPPLNRMILAVLALVGVVIAGYILLYSVGALTTLARGATGANMESVRG